MLDAAVKALSQMLSPPFRTVLLKSIGLALILIVLIGSACTGCWLPSRRRRRLCRGRVRPDAHMPLLILAKVLSVAAALGIIAGSVFLMRR